MKNYNALLYLYIDKRNTQNRFLKILKFIKTEFACTYLVCILQAKYTNNNIHSK